MTMDATQKRIVELLDRWQLDDLRKDTGHGYRSTKHLALCVGLERKACRALLEQMAAAGLIQRHDFANGLVWRSVNPLPWEVGGAMTETTRHTITVVLAGGHLSRVDAQAMRKAVQGALPTQNPVEIISFHVA